MDKQYKLTDRVSKDSIKSPIFKKWVKRILCIACIFSLALQLTLCCMPMMSYAAQDDSIVGTWVFNDTITKLLPRNTWYSVEFYSGGKLYYGMKYYKNSSSSNSYYWLGYTTNNSESSGSDYAYNYSKNLWDNSELRTVEFITNIEDETFITWLKANATRVVEQVYDFTGETRIFNDELTLFNTSDATFTISFNFSFDVLGVGTADYIILQRTTQNKYTMSYSFDFEDSGGLTMIYRDSPPFDNGESEWLGGKVNRKVITFITNPEDPEFQQWLLDNTTLFDNVKDAYQLGQQSGYNNGYEEGFANSLIGDSLSGPINALSQITLIEIQGTAITLGGVVMTAIALCLVLAFLKLYAGG